MIILGRLRQEVKVKVTPKMVHNTLHPNMHPQSDLGIHTFNSKGGMLQTRCEDSGTLNGQCDYPLGAYKLSVVSVIRQCLYLCFLFRDVDNN